MTEWEREKKRSPGWILATYHGVYFILMDAPSIFKCSSNTFSADIFAPYFLPFSTHKFPLIHSSHNSSADVSPRLLFPFFLSRTRIMKYSRKTSLYGFFNYFSMLHIHDLQGELYDIFFFSLFSTNLFSSTLDTLVDVTQKGKVFSFLLRLFVSADNDREHR